MVGGKRKRTETDDGMDLFLKMMVKLNKSNPPCQGFIQLMENLSTSTSTVGMFQIVDVPLMKDLKNTSKVIQHTTLLKAPKTLPCFKN